MAGFALAWLAFWLLMILVAVQENLRDAGGDRRRPLVSEGSSMQWCALVTALGFARRHFNVDHAWRCHLINAVFPVYILHQTLIILVAMALRPASLPD